MDIIIKKIKQITKSVYREISPWLSERFRWYLSQKIEKRAWKRWLKKKLFTRHKKWLDKVLKYFELEGKENLKDKTLVDIGSGPIGILTRLKAKEKIAVDPIPFNSIDASIKIIKAPGEEIPLNSQIADCVFLYNVLQHVMSPERVLNESARILKPGGSFYILEQLNIPTDPIHLHSLKLEMFDKWILKNNFKIIKKTIESDYSFNFDSFIPGSGYAILCLILVKI
ncbi:MAG: class I SAM-dependent methyltransferase [Patescibacteria group bacterium]